MALDHCLKFLKLSLVFQLKQKIKQIFILQTVGLSVGTFGFPRNNYFSEVKNISMLQKLISSASDYEQSSFHLQLIKAKGRRFVFFFYKTHFNSCHLRGCFQLLTVERELVHLFYSDLILALKGNPRGYFLVAVSCLQ